MSSQATTKKPAKTAGERVVTSEPSLPKKVQKPTLARYMSYKDGITPNQAIEKIENVESHIRDLTRRGHRVVFADGTFRMVDKPPNIDTVRTPQGQESTYLVDKCSVLQHTTARPRQLGIPYWPCEKNKDGTAKLKHSGKKVRPEAFKATKEDLKAALKK